MRGGEAEVAAFNEDNHGQNLWYATKWLEESGGPDAGGSSRGSGWRPGLVVLAIMSALFFPCLIVSYALYLFSAI